MPDMEMEAERVGGLSAPLVPSKDDDETNGTSHRDDRHASSPSPPPPPEITRSTKLYALCAALNSCNLGYDIGVIAGAVPLLQSSLNLTDTQVEAFVGSLNLFAMVGSIASGRACDALGRRVALRIAAFVFVFGVMIQSGANGYVALMVGRSLVGLGVGFGMAVDPMYISEISRAGHRGRLVTWSEVGINVGLLLGFASGLVFSGVEDDVAWRLMFAMGVVMPCFVIFCSIFVMPESPRWLVSKDRDAEAVEVLEMMYPEGHDVDVIVKKIKEGIEIETAAERSSGWNAVLFPTPAFKRMLLVGVGVAVAQQAAGISAIESYLVYILDEVGITGRGEQAGILIGMGVVKLGVIFAAGYMFDGRGRRPLFLTSLLGMAASLLLVSLGFLGDTKNAGLVVSGLGLYMASFSIGMGPGAWLVPSEVFSTLIRAKAMSVAAFMNRVTATAVSSTFLSMTDALSWFGYFLMMSIVCLIISVWVYFYLPETKGRPLEDMSRYFAELTGDDSILEAERMLHGDDVPTILDSEGSDPTSLYTSFDKPETTRPVIT